MKSVMISIKPKWCELIANGEKTIEVRKTRPKIETPFKCYIYETKGKTDIPTFIDEDGHEIYEGRGQVIGEFVCNNIDWHGLNNLIVKEDAEHALNGTCLTEEEVLKYLGYQKGTSIYACRNYDFYGWHISDLIIYDKPKELREFLKPCADPHRYCEVCTFGHVIIHSVIENYANYEIECSNRVTKPPQSWCYVEEAK